MLRQKATQQFGAGGTTIPESRPTTLRRAHAGLLVVGTRTHMLFPDFQTGAAMSDSRQ
jgi:hypothetical protein